MTGSGDTRPHVLIAGASIAGPGLAFWLNRYGWRTTVVERAPAFRDGGQNVDVRGAAREVIRRAGLDDTVKAATTGEKGTRFIGEGGSAVAEFPATGSETSGATAEVEILRGDLARILVGGSEAEGTEYRYGDRISGMHDDGTRVRVAFEHGEDRDVDVVVAADGIGSSTRRIAYGNEASVRSLGMEMTYLTVPRASSDSDWWRWYSAPGGLAVTLRPDRHGTTRAVLTSMGDRRADRGAAGTEKRTPDEQRTFLKQQFAGVGWEAQRVLDALDGADDMYYESIGQVRAPRWSNGRIALTGDAAWCASPVSGMGTSLSIVGAYVLAGELASHVHHRDGFAGYERIMRPFVDQAQDLPPGTPRLANPSTRAGIAVLHTVLRAAASRPARRLTGGLFSPPADKIELPDYGHLEAAR